MSEAGSGALRRAGAVSGEARWKLRAEGGVVRLAVAELPLQVLIVVFCVFVFRGVCGATETSPTQSPSKRVSLLSRPGA